MPGVLLVTDVYLSHLASAVGSQTQDVVAAEAAGMLFSSASALQDAGFDKHHYCVNGEDAYVLARQAVENSRIDTAAVDCIVYATCLPLNGSVGSDDAFQRSKDVKHLMDFPASRLQSELGMQGAFVVGLNQQACTGMLGSIRIAKNMLVAEPELNNVLCVTSDRFPTGALYEQAYNLISDGAGVCLVSREKTGFRILASHHVTNGALVHASDDETVGSFFTNVHQTIGDTLAKAGLTIQDMRWVVPQNTNQKAWRILAQLLQVSQEQAYFHCMADYGHVISADNVINLAHLEASGSLNPGDRVLTFMAGFGSNWQCLILERV